MTSFTRKYGSFSAKLAKWTGVKPSPDDLPRLAPYFVQGLHNFSINPKLPPAKTFMEMEKKGEISLEDMRKLTWLGANMFDKENGISAGETGNFWTIVKNGHDDPLEDFNACVHFLLGFSKSTFQMNYKVDNPEKRNTPDSDIEKIQMTRMQHALSALSQDQYEGLMDRANEYGLGGFIDDIVNNKNGAYLRSKEMQKRHIAWKNNKKKNMMDKNIEADRLQYTIADKQAFFDGVSITQYLDYLLTKSNASQEELKRHTKLVMDAMGSAGVKTRLKAGLETTQKISNDTIRKAYFFGSMQPFTMRGLKSISRSMGINQVADRNIDISRQTLFHGLNHETTQNLLFSIAHENNSIPELYFIFNCHDRILNKDYNHQLIDWCEKQGIDLDQILEDYEFPAMDNIDAIIKAGYEARRQMDAPETPEEGPQAEIIEEVIVEEEEHQPISKIERVMVPNLLPDGENNDGVPDLVDVFTQKQDPRPVAERELEPRPDWFREALENDPNVDHAKCREFYNPMETTDVSGRYYKVFHVVMLDGNTTQYAISRCKGQVTYILKADHGLMVDPITSQSLMDIPALRRERLVQTKRCKSQEGFTRDLMDLGFKNSADVTEQTKTATRWKGVSYRADQIFNSMTEYNDAMGCPPPANAGIIVHGELGTNILTTQKGDVIEVYKSLAEADTRWDLVDKAFRAGLIDGFEEVKSLGAFWKIFSEDVPKALEPKKLTA